MAIINGRGRVGIRRSAAASSYLLDTYSGSAVAYSLRKLSLAYSGSAIRVRRSSDNAEQNIGFDASGNLDTTALTSFVGAGNGFVTTWYDQSGNGRNSIQSIAANQPQIVSNGLVLTTNNKPSISFNGSSHNLEIPSSTTFFNFIHSGSISSIFSVAKITSNSNANTLIGNGGGFSLDIGFALTYENRSGIATNALGFVITKGVGGIFPVVSRLDNSFDPNLQKLIYSRIKADDATASNRHKGGINGGALFGNNTRTDALSLNNSTVNFTIGCNTQTGFGKQYFWYGVMQEIIIYNADHSSNRKYIESNINSHYSIYNTVFPEWSLNNVDGEQFLSALRNDVKSFNTGSIDTISNALFNGSYICSILGTDGKIYYIPYSANNILVFDPATNAVTTISVISGSAKWSGAALAPNGKIYAVPLNAAKVLILDIATSAVSYINSVGTGNYDWYGAVLAPNGKIYGLPYNNQNVLVVNTDTNTTSTINTGIAGISKWGGGVLAPNGKIYCIPNSNTGILVVDTNTNTTATFGSFTSGGSKWLNLVLAPNGKIYGIPFSSRHIIVINPNNNSSVLVDTSITSTYKWCDGVLAPNGKIYAMPSTLTDSLLEIDPDTNSFNNITISGLGSGYTNPKLAANGKIYFRNGSGTKVVSIGDSQTMNINRVLSRYVNLY